MYVVRRLAQGLSIYHQRTFRCPAVSRIHNPFTLGVSDVSSANLVGTENVPRLGDSLGSRRRDYDSGVGEKGRQVSTWNEWEHVTGGRGEAWWKARVPQENIAKKESRVVLRRARRCVSSTALAKLFADMSSVD